MNLSDQDLKEYVDNLKERRLISLAQEYLYEFFKQAWPHIEGEKPLIEGKHIEAICEHLEAVTYGYIKNLLINIPPRTGKTNIISIVWPAWNWIIDPSMTFVYASYATKISLEHSRKCRMLIESPWYQKNWGSVFQISKDQASKSHFSNNMQGHRIATSVTAGTTAMGGSIRVLDDPNDAKDGESKVTRDSTNDYIERVWPSRANPGSLNAQVCVQQRIDEDDVSGRMIANDIHNEVVKLIMPMEFEVARRCKTLPLLSTDGKPWQDWRTKEGELLWPQGVNEKDIKRLKAAMGQYNYSGQYQQRPSPAEGGLMKRHYFQPWKKEQPPKVSLIIQTWDTALKDGEENDYSVCQTWGVFEHEGATKVILLNLWRGKVNSPELFVIALRMAKDYRNDGNVEITPDSHHVPDMILIEDTSAGSVMIQEFRRLGIMVHLFRPTKDKVLRVQLILHLLEAELVYVPTLPPNYTKLRSFANILVEECAMFPKGTNDDCVDAMVQMLTKFRVTGLLTHPEDPEEEHQKHKTRGFYW